MASRTSKEALPGTKTGTPCAVSNDRARSVVRVSLVETPHAASPKAFQPIDDTGAVQSGPACWFTTIELPTVVVPDPLMPGPLLAVMVAKRTSTSPSLTMPAPLVPRVELRTCPVEPASNATPGPPLTYGEPYRIDSDAPDRVTKAALELLLSITEMPSVTTVPPRTSMPPAAPAASTTTLRLEAATMRCPAAGSMSRSP